MRPRDPALAVIALSALVVLALTGCITDTEPSRPVETATVSVEASPTTSDTGEPDEVLVSRDDLTFTAGTYSSLSEWPDILRQGTLRADSDDCLVLEDQSGTISGGGPEVSAEQARSGIEDIVLPGGCYDAATASFYLWVP